MNHDFDNEFETDDELKRGRSRRKDGRKYASSGLTGRTGSTGRGSRTARTAARSGKSRLRTIIIFIVAEIIALALIGAGWYGKRMMSLMQTDTEFNKSDMTNPYISVEKEQAMKGYWTVALFGVDSRDSSVGKGNMSDVIIICNINQETGEIKLVSLFRDTYLNVDDKNGYNKINQAYFRGGPKQAVEALNRNLDLEINDYATFNWKAVADAINILGGVDVELSKAEFYYINAYITETVESTGVGSYQLKSAGPNHLDGIQAVAYARLRKMDTDFARTERQRKIIQLSFDKLRQANFSVVNNVMEVVFPQILSSITLDDVIPAAKNLTRYHIGDTAGFPEARSDANMGKKGDCVIPQTLESNVVSLHKFLFGDENYTPSDMVKKISAKIASDTGLYKEGKPVGDVGTDGGYIPKTTEAKKEDKTTADGSESSSSSEKNNESTSSTKESIIDGETDFEYETDEDGNVIDPPEDYIPPTSKHSSETTQSSHTGESSQAHPGETTKAAHPGDSTESLKPTVPSGTLSPSRTTEAATTEAATKPYGPGSSETTAASSFNLGNSIKEENVGGPGEMISPAA